MKKVILILTVITAFTGSFSHADESTEQSLIKALMDANAYTKKNLRAPGGFIAKEGSLEFWSSGGLLKENGPEVPPPEYEAFNVDLKHITVITLVPEQVAIAQYYSEGSMHPKNSSAVHNYRTRVTGVFVMEDGKWKVRAAHWSPISGGSGTSQSVLDD